MIDEEETIFLKELGQRVKERRIALGFSQEDLAQKCGYAARSSVNRLEQGLLDVPHSKIITVSKALNVTPFWIMGWEDENGNALPIPDAFQLSVKEEKIIKTYRASDYLTQNMVLRVLGIEDEDENKKVINAR